VIPDLQVLRVQKVPRDWRVIPGQRAQLVLREQKAIRVHRVFKESREILGLLVHKA
jgi:hypothetical protein